MRIVVTGADGQLGAQLIESWTDDEVMATSRAELDVTDADGVARAIERRRPDVVVNCAAWTDVDGCEADPARAHAVNAVGAGNVAAAAAAVDARLLHLSTDYVHGGAPPRGEDGEPRGWRETDPTRPANEYGRSKEAGERLVRALAPDHVVVRTAWVCGRHGSNFVRTMLRLGRAGRDLAVVDDQIGSPTFTADLAVALHELARGEVVGTVNRTNAGRCSWFDLAAATFDEARLEVALARQPSSALDRPAPRPGWSVLDPGHADELGLAPLPHWRDGLRRLVRSFDGVDLG